MKPRVNWKIFVAGLLFSFAGQNISVVAMDTIIKGIPPLATLFPFSQSADKILKEAADTLASKTKKKPKAQSAIDRQKGLPPYVDDLDLDQAIEENPVVVAEFTAPEGSGPNIPWKIDMKGLKEEMKALGSKAKLVRVDVMKEKKLAAEFGQSHGPWPTLLMFKGDRRKIEVPLGDNHEMAASILAMEVPGYKRLTQSQHDKFFASAKGVALVAAAAYRSSNAIAFQNVAEQLLNDPVWNSGYGEELRCAYTRLPDDKADRWHSLQMKIPGQSELVTYPHPTWSESGIKQWALKATYPALWKVDKFDHWKFHPEVVGKLGFAASVVLTTSEKPEEASANSAVSKAFQEAAEVDFETGNTFAFALAPLKGVSDLAKVVLGVPLDVNRTQITILAIKQGVNQTYVTTDTQLLQTVEGVQAFLSDFKKGKLEPLPPPPTDAHDPKKVVVLDPTIGATEVTDSTWDSIVMDPAKDVFVMFTAPDEECKLCADLKPKYQELAQRVHSNGWDAAGLVIAVLDGRANPKNVPKDKFSGFPHFGLFAQPKKDSKSKTKKIEHFGDSKSAERMVEDKDLQRKFEEILIEQTESVRSKLMHLEL